MAKERENEREMHKENNERLTNGRVPSQKDEIERCPRENERRDDGDGESFEGRGGGFSKRAAFPQGLRRQYIHTRRDGEFLARLHYQDRLAYIQHNTHYGPQAGFRQRPINPRSRLGSAVSIGTVTTVVRRLRMLACSLSLFPECSWLGGEPTAQTQLTHNTVRSIGPELSGPPHRRLPEYPRSTIRGRSVTTSHSQNVTAGRCAGAWGR
jgi:hypothetical protein